MSFCVIFLSGLLATRLRLFHWGWPSLPVKAIQRVKQALLKNFLVLKTFSWFLVREFSKLVEELCWGRIHRRRPLLFSAQWQMHPLLR